MLWPVALAGFSARPGAQPSPTVAQAGARSGANFLAHGGPVESSVDSLWEFVHPEPRLTGAVQDSSLKSLSGDQKSQVVTENQNSHHSKCGIGTLSTLPPPQMSKWLYRLLYKLWHRGVRGYVRNWIRYYLTNKAMSTVVRDEESKWTVVSKCHEAQCWHQ